MSIVTKKRKHGHGTAPDLVNRPPHYTSGKIEVADFIDDQKLEHHTASAVEYICRSRHKGTEVQDLEKAIWRLQRRLSIIKKGEV